MFNSKKVIIFSFIFLLFLSSFAFLAPQEIIAQEEETVVQEGGGDPITGYIIDAIGGAISKLIFGVFDFLLEQGPKLLSFVLSDSFVNQSGSDSPVVQEGWGIVRNIANIALVIGLVIIAINIILGREEGQAKKTLVNFVIVALLINFTPLLCGFFIDGADIIAKSFMQGELNPNMNNQIRSLEDSVAGSGQGIFSIIVGIFALFVFTIASSFVYVLYALLFVARVVILWILIIVSPIALATKVFPKSNVIKKFFPSVLYWDDWLEMFVQWTVIVIPASLFIYLGNKAVAAVQMPPKEGMELIPFMIQSMFNFLIPLAFLLVGFMITISSGGQIAAPISNIAKKGLHKGLDFTKDAGKGIAGGYLKKRGEGENRRQSLKSTMLSRDTRDEGRVHFDKSAEELKGRFDYSKRRKEASEKEDYDNEEEEIKNIDKEYDKKISQNPQNEKPLNEKREEEKNKVLERATSEANREINIAKMEGNKKRVKTLQKNMGLFLLKNNEASLEKFEKEQDTSIEKIISGMSSQDIVSNVDASSFESPRVAGSITKKTRDYIMERGSPAQQRSLIKGIKKTDKEKQADIVKDIGSPPSPGEAADLARQGMARRADELDKKGAARTEEETREMHELAEELDNQYKNEKSKR